MVHISGSVLNEAKIQHSNNQSCPFYIIEVVKERKSSALRKWEDMMNGSKVEDRWSCFVAESCRRKKNENSEITIETNEIGEI